MAYTVASGDTLGKIARDAGITLDELLQLNPDITDPNKISIGQTVILTGTATSSPAATGSTTIATIATNEENYAKVQADYLAATGFEAYVGEDFQLHFVATDASLKALQDVGTFTIYTDPGGTLPPLNTDVQSGSQVKAEEDDIITPEGKEGEFAGVMSGGTIHRVDNPEGQEDFYIIEYEYPPGSGHSFYYRFSSVEALEQAVGPNLGGGKIPIGETIPETDLNKWTDGGDSNEIVGVIGSFNGFIDDISNQAGIDAGIDDPSLVGKALADPAIALIMAQASIGDWTKERIKAELRDTDYYKNVLYPGIENFYAQSQNPEADYAMYKQNVEASLKRLGIAPDANGGYGSQLTKLLDAGVSDAAFGTFSNVYQQAQTNVGFAASLSKWTEKYTGIAIGSFEDYFDVLAGNSPAEILEIAEVAGLQYMAENQGFVISDEELQLLSEGTDLDQGQAGLLFSQTARDLLSLGERGLRKGGLTSNQILEAEAGIGGNPEKVKLLMSKLAREEGLSDDPTATIFTDFNREGAPIKKGLGANISEGA